ncbi:MAG: anhydro-N-acetylmuramic acid kinase [Enterobacterales bacterium]|jgi:anhydro-N-acetylmuramic acid kinase
MSNLYIGIMSGTSMDAIDAVIIDFNNHSKIIEHATVIFPEKIHQEITTLISNPNTSLAHLGYLNIAITELYVDVVKKVLEKAKLQPIQISAIGCHGQTVFHQPDGEHRFSTQLGSGSYLAEKTNITTVTDFRNRDMAAGGQGAPLVPAFHSEQFKDKSRDRLIINIGGIANCTWIPSSGDIIGFDIGPGNTLMDCWIKRCCDKSYDRNGDWSATGTVSSSLLEVLLSDPYFHKDYPKSTGREYFNLDWLTSRAKQLITDIKIEDVQATLVELTAYTIAKTIIQFKPEQTYFCGGGFHNLKLISRINDLTSATNGSTEELGLDPDLVEAAAFGWLAKRCIENKKGTLASVTGAKYSTIAGAIYTA